ncbi:carbohydrate kinase family protein [Spongiactinospora gelatinilytica]|uniref:Carbohydrate kinase family protein n=1 Tax=Spongiactinospora gelatinilytica TaxID=2666298 RepID=A0A2W2HGY5_9ACTN|nr:carbohydrate kinase family protein [Spongiactinospora gelatinilytica]PZG54299.1 carbohydrate kinase family protein [Spongiactinospora gelatinilytica]
MRIAVTGSIATDNLMTFPGRFGDQLIAEQLDRVSLSFLVDDLQVRRGGIAANIAFGMGCLGLTPILVGAVGADFADYRSWLERHGVDCDSIHVSELHHTARFLCTTDQDHNQIASFYTGAMAEAREIELGPVADRVGGLDLVLVGANDPDAMLRHTEECRQRGIPFAADPSQQLARMEGEDIRALVEGATYLFTNEYEKALVEQKSGWSDDDVLARVKVRVTTLGPKGARIDRAGEPSLHIPPAPEKAKADPTGVGDAFRAGFLASVGWGLPLERCAQVGNLTATHVLEHVGGQEYQLARQEFLDRLGSAYGASAAAEVAEHIRCPHP